MLGKDLSYKTVIEGKRVSIGLILNKDLEKGHLSRTKEAQSMNLSSLERVWNSKFTRSNLGKTCIICDQSENVEMHHVRKIRDLKDPNGKLDFFTRQMAAINRKQVPLCRTHHNGLHNNTLTEHEREIFRAKTSGRRKSNKSASK